MKIKNLKLKIISVAKWCWATLPRKIISCLVIAGILLSSAWFLLFKPAPVEAGWWDEDWLYRRSVTVTNNTTAQTDVYISFDGAEGRPYIDTLVDTLENNKFQADCGDLRFTKLDGTQLDYYIESGCGTETTTVHVKLDTFQAGVQTIYFYYGNPSAENGFIGTGFSAEASDYSIDAIGDEKVGLGPVLWLKFDEGYGAFAYNSTSNDAGKLPGTELDTSHPLADGLVGLWLMNEGSGSTVADLSGNGLVGTFQSTTSWGVGKFGPAVFTNGTTDYIRIPQSNLTGHAQISVVMWIWAESGPQADNYARLLGFYDFNGGYSIGQYSTTNQLSYGVYNSLDEVVIVQGNTNFFDGNWHQIAMTYDGANICVYEDGVFVNSGAQTGLVQTTALDLDLGSKRWNVNLFAGAFDHVMIYNRALSDTEIEQLYAEPFAMISDTGASRISGASWTNSGKFDKALDFDGVDDYVDVTDFSAIDNSNTELSISAWVKFDTIPTIGAASTDRKGIVAKYDAGNDKREFMLTLGSTAAGLITDDSVLEWNVQEAADVYNGDNKVLSNTDFVANKWYQIVVTFESATKMEIYVNGILDSSKTSNVATDFTDTGTALLIGNGADGMNFDGVIDEVIIYPYARSAVQVKRDYNKGASARIGRDDSWLTDGLVGYWKMDETSWSGVANEVIDSSGAGNHGVRSGNATTTGGKFGKAGTFDGDTDYVTAATPPGLSDITYVVWFKSDLGGGTTQGILRVEDTFMRISSVFTWYPNVNLSSASYTYTFTAGVWYQLAVTQTGTSYVMYINGDSVKSGDGLNLDLSSSGSDVRIGSLNTEGTWDLDGQIDDVRIYNRALSEFEVRRLYDWGPPPVAHWKMDEMANDTCTGGTDDVCDTSENSNDGAINGDPTWKNAAECKYGNCLEFDGVGDYVNYGDVLDFTTEDFSVSLWMKSDSENSRHNIINKHTDLGNPSGVNEEGWLLSQFDDVSGRLRGNINDDGDSGVYIYGPASNNADDGNWHHVVMVMDRDGDGIIYTDTVAGTGVDISGQALSISTPLTNFKLSANALTFNGQIDDVRIYDYALTPKQITEVMMGGRPAITETTSSPGVTMGYWKFDEGFGNTAYDASGRNNNLTHYTEAYTMSGKFGKAWDGDGTKYLSRANDPDFNFTATEDFSISGWFKHSPITETDYIIAKYKSVEGGYKIYMDLDGDIVFAIDDDDEGASWDPGDVIGNDQARDYDDNSWHYFAAVKRGTSSIRLYVDGREIDNDTDLAETGSLVNTDLLYVGIDSDASTGAFDGELDEIKIYRFALSPEEILLDYNKGKAVIMGAVGTELQGAADQKPTFGTSGSQLNTDHPLADGIVGLWLMNEGTGTTIADLSGNENMGTLAADVSWVPGKYGTALDFDGTGDYVDVGQDSSLKMTTACTVCAWVKSDVTVSGERNIVREQTTGKGYALGAGWTANKFRFYLNAGGWTSSGDSITNIVAGTEYFVCGTYDKNAGSNQVKLWVNGINENSGTDTDSISWLSNNILIGAYNPASGAGWNGKISHVVIFNRALSAEEIKWLYAEPFAMLNLPTVPSFSQNRAYCPPGYVGLCSPPVGEWKMDEYSGDYAYDTSSNTNKGTLTGPPTWKGAGDCKYGSCLDFDGDGDCINMGDKDELQGDNYTYVFWIKSEAGGETYQGILSKLTTSTSPCTGIDILKVGNSLRAYIDSGSPQVSDADFFVQEVWAHAAIVFDNGNATIYKNGVSAATGEYTSITSTDMNFYIGRQGASGSRYFLGAIDDVKIFDYALSQEQIAWLYNRGKPVGHWKFDEGEGSTAKDSSENNNTGTLTNMASDDWVTGKFNSGLDFAGDNDYVTIADSSKLSFGDGTTDKPFSVSAWVNADDITAYTIASKATNTSSGTVEWIFAIDLEDELKFIVYDDISAIWLKIESSSVMTAYEGTWTHFAFSYDGSSSMNGVVLYVNGVAIATKTGSSGSYTAMHDTSTPIESGVYFRSNGGVVGWSDGKIDNLMIYNYELTAEQVKLDYNQGSALRFGD